MVYGMIYFGLGIMDLGFWIRNLGLGLGHWDSGFGIRDVEFGVSRCSSLGIRTELEAGRSGRCAQELGCDNST